MSVADFHARFRALVEKLGGTPDFDGRPNEIADAIPFRADKQVRPYDADAVTRFFHALVAVSRVLLRFRTGFIGKVSPVHLFWGSFDLAVTRFSGRRAPLHPGGIPNLPDEVTREAYSDEVSSAGFWPGGGGTDFPAFYSYAYPTPKGFGDAQVQPAGAYFDSKLGEFILPYDVARNSADPEAALMDFLESTYQAAADLGGWNRDALECAIGSRSGRARCVIDACVALLVYLYPADRIPHACVVAMEIACVCHPHRPSSASEINRCAGGDIAVCASRKRPCDRCRADRSPRFLR